jgi:hypothetical protein
VAVLLQLGAARGSEPAAPRCRTMAEPPCTEWGRACVAGWSACVAGWSACDAQYGAMELHAVAGAVTSAAGSVEDDDASGGVGAGGARPPASLLLDA